MTDRMGLQVRAAEDRPDHVPRRLRASPTLGAGFGVPGSRCTCGGVLRSSPLKCPQPPVERHGRPLQQDVRPAQRCLLGKRVCRPRECG